MSKQLEIEVETWSQKCERLARELKACQIKDPCRSTKKQRDAYRAKRYELQCHLDEVCQ